MDKGSNKLKQALPDTKAEKGVSSGDDAVQAALVDGVGSAFDDNMPQTCCSTCKTVFEVSPELLASSDTRVRCGECLSIFDALTNLRLNDIPEEDGVLLDEDGNSIASNEFFSQGVSGDINDHTHGAASDTPAHGQQSIRAGEDEAALDLPTAADLTHTEDLTGTADLTHTEDLPGAAGLTRTEDLPGATDLTHTEVLPGAADLTHTEDLPDTADLTQREDPPGTADLTQTEDLSGTAELTQTEELSGTVDLTQTGELPGAADLTHTEESPSTASSMHTEDRSRAVDPTHAGHLPRTDYDLFSGNAGLPDVAYFDQTREMGSLNFDEPDGDETFSDEIFAHDLTIGPTPEIDTSVSGDSTLDALALDSNVDFVTDDVKREPVVFNYNDRAPEAPDHSDVDLFPGGPDILPPASSSRAAAKSSSASSGRWALRGMLALLVLVIAGGLYGYRNRQAIVQNPDMRPLLNTACSVIGCQLPPLVKLDELKVLKRSVFSHPTLDNELVIDLAFINEADFSQAFPVLEIRLTNLSGGLVSQKDIEPADYLDDWQAGDLLSAGRRLDLSLTVEDPGQTATSFELKFR